MRAPARGLIAFFIAGASLKSVTEFAHVFFVPRYVCRLGLSDLRFSHKGLFPKQT